MPTGRFLARFSSASGRGEFINVTNHRRPLIHLLHSDWSISHHPDLDLDLDLEPNYSMLTQPFCLAERAV